MNTKEPDQRPVGRPTKLTPELVEHAKGYLPSCVDDIENKKVKLPSIFGFAVWLNVSRETIYQWAKENKELSDTLRDIEQLQADRLVNNSLSGNYNPTIAKLMLSANHGMVEKTASELTGKDGGPIETTQTISDDQFQRIISGFANRQPKDSGTEEVL